MDPALFQLFSLGEILTRLGQTLQTGCLHVFTQRASANIFFKEGIVVAAVSGSDESEKVVDQVLEWKDAHMVWQPKEIAPASFKAFSLNIVNHLQAQIPGRKEIPKPIFPASVSTPAPAIPAAKPVVFTPEASHAPSVPPASTTAGAPGPGQKPSAPPLPVPVSTRPAAVTTAIAITPSMGSMPVELTATKTIPSTAQARSAQEEALLRKHRLLLVSAQDPKKRIKITRVSSLIGRNPACDIHLDHASISRQHCLLQLTDRGVHLKDLDTTNGTKVNGIPLTDGYVNAGDKVAIGHEVFMLIKDKE